MMSKIPKVSIVSISYNQEKYIRQALDSFLMQKTDFDFEVIIGDDCSTDGTPAILAEYAKAYPDIIKPILRTKNLGPQKNATDVLRAAKAKYIAVCEGDDFWTDPEKLQRQVDFLEGEPEYALCFHPVRVVFENNEEKESVYPDRTTDFTTEKLLEQNFIQTNSVMYRRQNYDNMPTDVLPLDWYWHLYHAQFGKIGFIDKVMSAYRRHPGGIWWESYSDINSIWKKHGIVHLGLFMEILKLYGSNAKYKQIVYASVHKMFESFIAVDKSERETVFLRAAERYPKAVEEFAVYEHDVIKALEQELAAVREKARQTTAHYEDALRERAEQIADMKASKFWKLRNAIATLVGKEKV
jgi:glycosyltransferase involved in cell wall biosynthesis